MSNPPRIAIVDDDAHLRDALHNLVRSAGFAAEGFETADSFIHRESAEPVDAIVTDCQMPGIDGIRLIELLRSIGDATPVIAMSGRRDVGLRNAAISAGAGHFLEKPFDPDLLIELIEGLVGRVR